MKLDVGRGYATAGHAEDQDGVMIRMALHGKRAMGKEDWGLDHIQIRRPARSTILA